MSDYSIMIIRLDGVHQTLVDNEAESQRVLNENKVFPEVLACYVFKIISYHKGELVQFWHRDKQ